MLADDSDAIVVGTVTGQTVERGILDEYTDFTVNDVETLNVVKGDDAVKAGEMVKVRQTGSADQPSGETFLQQGDTYLLYLTLSGLDGDLAGQYYVTGATAGVYQAFGGVKAPGRIVEPQSDSADDDVFRRVNMDSGDTLPAFIALDQVSDQ